MNLIKCILTKNDCYKEGKTIKPQGVMVHSTAANNPKLSRYVQPNVSGIGTNPNNNDWNRSGVGKCVHAFIGKKADGSIATAQTLPWNWRGWHGGKSASNNKYISFEICEDSTNDKSYFDKVYKEAVELTAMLCKQHKLDPLKDGVVICHSEGYKRGIASNHSDVMHWFPKHGKDMDDFRNDVAMLVGAANMFKPHVVKVTANVLNVRSGAGTSYKVVQAVKKGEAYTIVEEKNGWGKLKSGTGWISLKYTKKI